MEYLEQLFGVTLDVTMRAVIAFAIVLVLIVAIAWIFRRISRGGLRGERRGRVARLAILEAIVVDQRRRLVLLRRDSTEHLVMIGGNSDLVIEQGIRRAAQQPGVRPAERQEPAMRAAARPRAAEPARPEPARPEPARPAPARAEPAPAAKRPEPAPAPRPAAPASPAAAAKPAAAEARTAEPARAEPRPAANETRPAPAAEAKTGSVNGEASAQGGDVAEDQLTKMADRLKAALREQSGGSEGQTKGSQTESDGSLTTGAERSS